MLEKFRAKKNGILERLSKSDAEYADASPKGTVDEGIRELVAKINSIPGFVTTSSCAGRIAVFLEGARAQTETTNDATGSVMERLSAEPTASAGGKGGGKWLFTSHDPINIESVLRDESLYLHFGFPSGSQISYPPPNVTPQFVHFKFEPMILHVLASSAENAQDLLSAAMNAGFRESGISGLLDSKKRPSAPMVSVRSSGLMLDSIIGFRCPDSSYPLVTPMVSEDYLHTLVQMANERFTINDQRKARFRQALKSQPGLERRPVTRHGYEPAQARKERKHKEGLMKRESMLSYAGAVDGAAEQTPEVEDGSDDDGFYGLGNFTDEQDAEPGSSAKEPNGVADYG